MELVYQVSRFRENIQDDFQERRPIAVLLVTIPNDSFLGHYLSILLTNAHVFCLSKGRQNLWNFGCFFFFIGLVKYQANLHIDDQGSLEISQDILIDVGCLRSYYNVLIDSRPLMLANLHNTTAGIRLNRG